jgi:8-oxo-dGTP pyrophosphatase MutT (NUDIX family)
MSKAARAIIIENNQILLMKREKEGQTYFTLIGGGVNEGETEEGAVKREVREETKLEVTKQQLCFIEEHPEPYKQQYTFVCEIAPHGEIGLEDSSEEANLNRYGLNTHTPVWVDLQHFHTVPFRTVHLQSAIVKALKEGFPTQPIKI